MALRNYPLEVFSSKWASWGITRKYYPPFLAW
jgi:hypothetical protein